MSLKITQQHLPEVRAAYKRRGAAIAPAFRAAGAQVRRLVVALFSAYPAERPGQTYVRTEALKRGWERATPIETGLGFALINSVAYASLVQGDKPAWMHVGRWKPAQQIVSEHQAEILAIYEAEVQREVLS